MTPDFDTPEYQKFAEEMARDCKCQPPFDRPCGGLLAGGLCDQLGTEPWFEGEDRSEPFGNEEDE